jgi:hypothetical protein
VTDTPAVNFDARDSARLVALRGLVAGRGALAVFVTVLVLGVTAAIVMEVHDPYALVLYGDAASHLVKSRSIVDWGEDIGLARFGTVWLPVPHLLFLPFTLVGSLFSSGWAGAVVGLTCLALSAAFLYGLIRREIAAPPYLAAAGALLYALNPNILYVSMTAMTEAPFMLFFIGSAYYLSNWLRAPDRLRPLAIGSALAALATLSRYEGWILPFFIGAFVAWRAVRGDYSERRRIGLVALVLVAFTGVAAWVVYNACIYGDPLQFADVQYYSASSQAQTRPFRETLFLQPLTVLAVYGWTAVVVYGPVLLAAVCGMVRIVRTRRSNRVNWLLLAYLALPSIFTVTTMVAGIGEMAYWFNSRFLILLSPLLIVLATCLVQRLTRNLADGRLAYACSLAVCLTFSVVMVAAGEVPTYRDARGGFDYQPTPSAVQVGEKLKSTYDGGKIVTLTGSGQEQRIMVTAGIPLGQYDELLTSSTWKGSYVEPWRYGRWLILSKDPDSDAESAVAYWNSRMSDLDTHYSVAYENADFKVLLRHDGN